jgi:hypothetical protein
LKIADALEGFRFDLKLIGSTRYNLTCLEKLKPQEISNLKEAFIDNDHPRLAKEIVTGRNQRPYGTKRAFVDAINQIDLLRFAKLIRVVGMLLQVKAYLFWQRPSSA